MSFTDPGIQVFVSRLLSRFRNPTAQLVVAEAVWDELLDELCRRGQGRRESGAFLLGPDGSTHPRRVSGAVYYDDLDPDCLTGGISFRGSAYGRLWGECIERRLQVVADVHTHPGPWVSQSPTDRAHPMLGEANHIALIVPNFARGEIDAGVIGVHTYLGEGRWRSAIGAEAARQMKIERRRS
jgi:proteasome lid subunit RPN8/RPN11